MSNKIKNILLNRGIPDVDNYELVCKYAEHIKIRNKINNKIFDIRY